MTYNQKSFLLWAAMVFIVVTLNGCASLFGDTEGVEEKPRKDVLMAMKVKSALIETAELSAAAIEVEASNGRIQLSGFVETASQRRLASDVANQVTGVKEVRNQIKIK